MAMRGSKTAIVLILMVLWILAGSSLSADSSFARVEQKLQSSQFSETDKDQLMGILEQAEQQLIPTEVLVLRLEEGLAKRIPPHSLYNALMLELQAYNETRKLVLDRLGHQEGTRVLSDSTIWSRTATLYRQGVPEVDLAALLDMFNRQKSQEKWDNYRYGGGLLIALRQWGLDNGPSLSVIEALSRSPIQGEDYRVVVDLFTTGFANRIAPDDMVRRIVQSAPRSRSITMLERLVR